MPVSLCGCQHAPRKNQKSSEEGQKQIRDLQGKVQEGLNASAISSKIAALKTDPNKASMFYGDDKFNQQQKHNLSVFDKDRVGIDLTNFTATPKEYTDADLSKEMGKYKPAGLEDLIKEPDPTDKTKEIVRSVPKYDDTQLDQMKLSSLYRYNNNVGYKEKVDKMVSSPDTKPLLDNLFQHYYNRPPASGNEYSMAYDLSKLPITAEKRTIVTNGQQKFNAANAENDRRAARNQGYKQSNILLNKNNLPQESSGNSIDQINGVVKGAGISIKDGVVRDRDGKLFTGDNLELEKDALPSSILSNIKKNGFDPNKVDRVGLKVVDGKIMQLNSNHTGAINRQDMENFQNNKVPKSAVPATYGNAKAKVPSKQNIPTKKGKYD